MTTAGKPDGWNPELYDTKHGFVWQYGEDLIGLLDPRPGERIMDLGCGTGHLSAEIALRGANVVGVDASPTMIEHARARYPEVEFRVADATRLRVKRHLDAVFSNAVFHWIADPEAAVAHIARALRAGGRFVAEFGGHRNVEILLTGLQETAREAGLPATAAMNPWYYPTVAQFAALLERHGLDTRFAMLFDRPTPLEEGAQGLRNWLDMFAGSFAGALPPSRRAGFFDAVEERLRPALFQGGTWYADYRRLRIVAAKL